MEADDINVKELEGKKDKIRELMSRDPKFIARLITQLDTQMHKMMREKYKRSQAVKEDQEALTKLEAVISTHVTPNLEKVNDDLQQKQQMKEQVQKQLDAELANLKNLEREAAALISRARHASGKLMGKTASDSLQEARGFTSTTPTTQIIRAKKKS
eukprot:jgi/Chrzof1/14469/Cz09g03320.t1